MARDVVCERCGHSRPQRGVCNFCVLFLVASDPLPWEFDPWQFDVTFAPFEGPADAPT